MFFLAIVAALFVGYGTAYVASDDVRYLTRAGLEETQILKSRRPIAALVKDPDIAAETRAQLRLVLDARNFAADLGLEAKDTYTAYTDVGRDTLLLVLSAAPMNCICPVTWKYPIVGKIPYKGFFDVGMAQKQADKLAAKGFDVHLRPSGAFSTLGWFNDPLLSTALSRDSVELAALVFHEIAHNTVYVKSATPFNESFAQLVGYRAAEAFFRQRGDTALAQRAADRWHDEMVLGDYYAALIDRLETFYATKPDAAALAEGRAKIAAWARLQLEGPVGQQLRTYRFGKLPSRSINNARLVGVRIYRTQLGLFERWYQEHGANIQQSVADLRRLLDGAEGDEAFARLEAAVAEAAIAEPARAGQ